MILKVKHKVIIRSRGIEQILLKVGAALLHTENVREIVAISVS